MTDEKQPQERDLNVLFPGEEVEIDGQKVMVKPLPLSKLPKIIDAFSELMRLVEVEKVRPGELALKGMSQLLEILPYCIDVELDRIPAYALPDLLEKMIEQNITDATVGKWQALVQKVPGLRQLKIGQEEKGKDQSGDKTHS